MERGGREKIFLISECGLPLRHSKSCMRRAISRYCCRDEMGSRFPEPLSSYHIAKWSHLNWTHGEAALEFKIGWKGTWWAIYKTASAAEFLTSDSTRITLTGLLSDIAKPSQLTYPLMGRTRPSFGRKSPMVTFYPLHPREAISLEIRKGPYLNWPTRGPPSGEKRFLWLA